MKKEMKSRAIIKIQWVKLQSFFSILVLSVMMASCNSGATSDEHKDSANTLQDTFPANGLKDSMAVDSNAPDATHVDSLEKLHH